MNAVMSYDENCDWLNKWNVSPSLVELGAHQTKGKTFRQQTKKAQKLQHREIIEPVCMEKVGLYREPCNVYKNYTSAPLLDGLKWRGRLEEQGGSTHTRSWASWPTTGCSSGRWCFSSRQARRRGDTQSAGGPHAGNPSRPSYRKEGYLGLRSYPGQFLQGRERDARWSQTGWQRHAIDVMGTERVIGMNQVWWRH